MLCVFYMLFFNQMYVILYTRKGPWLVNKSILYSILFFSVRLCGLYNRALHVLKFSCLVIPFSSDYLAWGRESLSVCFSCICLFVLYVLVFVIFLFLLVSGVGCGLWLWHSLDSSINFLQLRWWLFLTTSVTFRTKQEFNENMLVKSIYSRQRMYT